VIAPCTAKLQSLTDRADTGSFHVLDAITVDDEQVPWMTVPLVGSSRLVS